MASRRSRGRGVTPGTIRGKDKNWLSEGMEQRRYRYAMDTANGALNKTETCKKCGGLAGCINAAVLKNFGVRAYWKCTDCGREYTKEISSEKMEQYYQEDLAKMHSKPQEAEA
jgi:transcription elongation factor Elf1